MLAGAVRPGVRGIDAYAMRSWRSLIAAPASHQSFNAGKGRSLEADVPIPCRSAETARRTAERLAPAKAGVVAFSTAGDAELGDYDDEPTMIFKTGQLPAHFEET